MEICMLIAEITDEMDKVISATGVDDWTCMELPYRRSFVETMSHSRGIIEYYDLSENSYSWMYEDLSNKPVVLDESITYLERRAPYPSYEKKIMKRLAKVSDIVPKDGDMVESNLELARLVNRIWYSQIPEENKFLEDLMRETDALFSGRSHIESKADGSRQISISNEKHPCAVMWESEENMVGFLSFHIEVDAPCTLDIIHSDHLSQAGYLEGNTYATRYRLEKGTYDLTTFEPKLICYAKFIIRSKGTVSLSYPTIIDYSYTDIENTFFECSDGELNRIYKAARKTLKLNTLDIFMDCPERERGGWLCDSYFSSRAAWQMFGDSSVEKDFIENFLLTDPDKTWNSFFPEVYPATRGDGNDVGIRNWSFWLMLEICDYYHRTGDRSLLYKYEMRIQRFIDGVLSLRGESG